MPLELARLSSRGQVVIPRSIREKLGLRRGERLLVAEEEEAIVMKPVSRVEADVEAALLDIKRAALAWREVEAGRARVRKRAEFRKELARW